ncbi:sigma-70 family RNA polymerase sigma factor [Planctomyces sp. SH-PL62]|uniref:sigma-70 family RNA polymerase sigma factor n=1 Tax=Planctomyces sp. SH-PL62 TaxID=1636152 RepID=UPI00078DF686|nr:sigma-70 family RNA polymerase sigma factor [Planctomyces sp. SH-PL62]AMV36617.1 ECF RNA polymerase sigma-E factor [Planctomyces sp. SH-PL62]
MSRVGETPSPPVERLLDQARGGDGAALGLLLQRYHNYLSLLARVQIGRRIQAKVDVSDVLQDVSLEVHRRIGGFRGGSEGEFLAWMRQILGGVLADQIRRYLGAKRRDVRLERELGEDLDRSSRAMAGPLAAVGSSPSARASRREQAVILADAINGLPPDYREVIILRQLEGLSFPEVAERMERTQDSVKNLWARALARLRRGLEALDGD